MLPTDQSRVEIDATELEKSEAIRLLIVEDSDEDAYLLNTRLQRQYPGVFQTQVVRTVESAAGILSEVAGSKRCRSFGPTPELVTSP